MTESLPWVKWRFDRWRNEETLRMCGLGARGLWADLLAVMHGCEPYGHLVINGRPPSPKQVASLVGMTSEKEVVQLLHELETNGVFSRTPDGLIYCRRMVRDNVTREKESSLGENGWLGGNPNLVRGTVPKEKRSRPYRRSDSPEKTERIFAKSGGCCHWCGKTLQRETAGHDFFQVDHVVAIRDGGDNDEANLVAACADCNHKRARVDWQTPTNPTITNDEPTLTLEEKRKEEKAAAASLIQEEVPRAKPAVNGHRHGGRHMPTLDSPWPAWEWLTNGEVEITGANAERRPCAGGFYLDAVARDVCDAAGIDGHTGGIDWSPLVTWLRAGIGGDVIVSAIKKVAGRDGYEPKTRLTYFDKPVREAQR